VDELLPADQAVEVRHCLCYARGIYLFCLMIG
jgi:hypothetical protein